VWGRGYLRGLRPGGVRPAAGAATPGAATAAAAAAARAAVIAARFATTMAAPDTTSPTAVAPLLHAGLSTSLRSLRLHPPCCTSMHTHAALRNDLLLQRQNPYPPIPCDPALPLDTHKDLSSVAVLEGKSRVADQVGQTVVAAQQTRLGVVGKAVLGALDGGLESQSWGAVGLVLRLKEHQTRDEHQDLCLQALIWACRERRFARSQAAPGPSCCIQSHLLEALVQALDLVLEALGISLRLAARGEPCNVGLCSISGPEESNAGKGSSSDLRGHVVADLSLDNDCLAGSRGPGCRRGL